MVNRNRQAYIILAVIVASITAAFLFLPAIPQDPAYHNFAERRPLLNTPNFWNVWSNPPFVLVGIFGLLRLSEVRTVSIATAYSVFCLGIIGIGFGSMYYHYAPTTTTLVWDRLPMTIAFMALVAMVIGDRLSESLGKRLLWPLVLIGAASVAYWHWTELHHQGDLRPYGLVQFLPMLLIPLLLFMNKGKYLNTPWLWATLGINALAKIAEHFDTFIYSVTGNISGHSIKHFLGALAVLCAIFAIRNVSMKKHGV